MPATVVACAAVVTVGGPGFCRGYGYHVVVALGVCRYGPGKAALGFVCVKRARARKWGVCTGYVGIY